MMVIVKAKCGISPHHFLCRIFDTKKEMYDYYTSYIKKASIVMDPKLDFSAICMPYVKKRYADGKWIQAKDLGEILFYKDNIGAGIVSHELGHAAFWWSRHIKRNKNAVFGCADKKIRKREEDMLTCMLHLVRTFTNKCYKIGVYR